MGFHFSFLTLLQLLTSGGAALTLETLRRLGRVRIPPFSLQLAKDFAPVCVLSTLQSSLTLLSLRGLSLPMYVVFKRCLPLFTLSIGGCVLKDGVPSVGVATAVIITTGGAALAGAGDLSGDPFGYVTGVLAVIVHASYLVLIQKGSLDREHGPLTAQYAIATMATPVLLLCSFISTDAVSMWSYAGWSDPHVTAIFVCCVLIGGAMNFTTLHCTYINSAVTTSFVGVVKSIATITVGMLALDDVAPTGLFIGGVAVNTVGSVTYCIVKYYEMKRRSLYEDLEEEEQEQRAPPGEPCGDEPAAGTDPDGKEANGQVCSADRKEGRGSTIMTEQEVLEMQREHLHKESPASSYVGVWRSVRHLQFLKREPLISNMEQQSP
ncbi:solute carrier family 35 member D3-like [Brachionichthys hirsutus]|uniref:solute carrier family 35 member D3-like n=1 Tax=Brachionichthys hirsutus TaxID=412623 RepID=UPI003604B702